MQLDFTKRSYRIIFLFMSIQKVRLTILGSGTSTGVPIIKCKCRVCRSRDPKNKRLRASVWFQVWTHHREYRSFLVDTSTDLREQALRFKIDQIDAVLYTHPHADHVQGIDEIRSFNYYQKSRILAFGNSWTERELKQRFRYIFQPGVVEGGGIPKIKFVQIPVSSCWNSCSSHSATPRLKRMSGVSDWKDCLPD